MLCFIVLLFSSLVHGVCLDKLFYHHGRCSDRIVFYLSSDPAWQRRVLADGTEEIRILLAGIKQSLKTKIRQTGTKLLDKYGIRLFYDTTQKQLQLFVIPRHAIVRIDLSRFTAIGGSAGITLTLVKKGRYCSDDACVFVPVKRSVPVVVLDPGHGGADAGAKSRAGVTEKEITLAVAKQTAALLKKRGYKVVMTRRGDITVPLDMRTHIANSYRIFPSLFVSIHCNSAPSSSPSGVETYYFDTQLLKSKAQPICETRAKESARLAHLLQQALLSAHSTMVDRKVKTSVTQVLLGSEMPAALLELGFLSHPQEGVSLASKSYQQALAKGIAQAIDAYFQ